MIVLLFLYSTEIGKAFDVKVLLATFTPEQLQQAPLQIQSNDGFLIIDRDLKGVLHTISAKDILISHKNGCLFINDHEHSQKKIQIHAILPQRCLQKISDFIKQKQHECNQELLESQIPDIHSWSYSFLTNLSQEHEKYQEIYDHVQNSIESIVELFFESLEETSISSEVLHKKLFEFLQIKLNPYLHNGFQSLQISAKDAKSIKRNEQARIAMLEKVIDPIVYTLAYDFIEHLPQKVLRNFLQEDCGALKFQDLFYMGSLQVVQDGQKIMIINCVPIEDYLVSVLRDEGWPGWSLEANKVLAIACRTYLVSKIMKSRALKLPYHIKNSVHHQTYNGKHRKIYEKLKTAVKETHNVFLAYDGKPIEAMFDSCCGGIIPANISGYDFKKHPYLARTKPCNYCKSAWIYSWDAQYDAAEIKELLAKHDIKVSKVLDMKITKKDKAGLVQELCIAAPERKITISGRKAYSIFSNIHSFAFSVSKKEKRFTVKGKGYGHHMGLCQWGAMNMIKDGYDYQRVLQFYYPGTTFMQFTHS